MAVLFPRLRRWKNGVLRAVAGQLRSLYFRVTINTDNRLMSGTSMTSEFVQLADAFGYDLKDFQWFTVNAMKSAFIPFDERLAMINDVIKPGYAALAAQA